MTLHAELRMLLFIESMSIKINACVTALLDIGNYCSISKGTH